MKLDEISTLRAVIHWFQQFFHWNPH